MKWVGLLCIAACLSGFQMRVPKPNTAPPPTKIGFTSGPIDDKCLAGVGDPHCDGPLFGPVIREYSFKKTAGNIATAAATVLTYHNDVIGGFDGSFDLEFRTWLMSAGTATGVHPVYYQHKHTQDDALHVATRISGKDSLTKYEFVSGDQLEVYRGEPAEPLNDTGIFAGSYKPDFVIKLEKLKMSCYGCEHKPGESLWFWSVTPAEPLKLTTTPDKVLRDELQNVVGAIHRQTITTDTKILRRLVIRNAGIVRYFIPLESGCSAFKICASSKACRDKPLCRLDADDLFRSKRACARCGVLPPTGQTTGKDIPVK